MNGKALNYFLKTDFIVLLKVNLKLKFIMDFSKFNISKQQAEELAKAVFADI